MFQLTIIQIALCMLIANNVIDALSIKALTGNEGQRSTPLLGRTKDENNCEFDRREWILNAIQPILVPSLLLPSEAVADSGSASSPPFYAEMEVQIDAEKSGTIEIEVLPEWAPLAADRFRELVEIGFFDDSKFFRVLPNYVAQFGIASDPQVNQEWLLCEKNCRALPDELRLYSNKAGTLSFASSGKNSRQTQIFINLADNSGLPNFLDQQGFVPFARVIKGFDSVVKKLNTEYGLQESLTAGLSGSVNQGKAAYYGK
eukprot:CAMPEP_0178904158 /NCGR_PEP_ID=MMETSP0786-20121207/5544_1 /TAXON_ID=186022 /ORGANISM="Thalassionema frauenfeldii, Strain CCMP 1798" /LENGTH=258 /DNA_ID=CAMNT_0020575583 /DNA_START=90 /DNA_END=863 /DNA_ORIENTATION=+